MAMVSSSDFLRAPERPTAIATLNRQRHLTPSCGGLTPTAERTVGPARISLESLTPRPGIREQNQIEADADAARKATVTLAFWITCPCSFFCTKVNFGQSMRSRYADFF